MDLLDQRVDGAPAEPQRDLSLQIDVVLSASDPKANVFNFNQLVREETGTTAVSHSMQAVALPS